MEFDFNSIIPLNVIHIFLWFTVNKRLDDWVTEEHLDTRKVQFPRKDGTTTGQNTGVTTPKRFSISAVSRPTSPKGDADSDLLNGSAVMAAALQKKISRKRKVSIWIRSAVCSVGKSRWLVKLACDDRFAISNSFVCSIKWKSLTLNIFVDKFFLFFFWKFR